MNDPGQDKSPNTDEPAGRTQPVLHAPEVHTMRMGHIPLAAFSTVAVAFLLASAFHLDMAHPIASTVILVALFVLATIVPTPPPTLAGKDGDASAQEPTAGTRFTMVRILVACTLGGLAVIPPGLDTSEFLWTVFALGVTASLVEAMDNWLARITDSDSRYSERLASMTASFFALFLALLPLQLGLTGIWVVAAGILGFADAAIAPRGPRGEIAPWQVWSRMAARLLLLAVLAPPVPDIFRPAAAGLAIAILLGHVVWALYARIQAAKHDGRSIFDA